MTLLPSAISVAAPVQKPNDDWAAPGEPRPALKVGETLPPRIRTPQFPLKDRRTLHSEAEIALARDNVARFPAAKRVAEEIIADADYWVDWTDEALRDLIVTAEVPRSFEVCPEGCPVHGRKVFELTGKFYPWIVDPKKPFQVTCPVGGETYPGNDYGRFYRSGFKDRTGLDQPYADDGRGWVAPDGQRYWFVAHWHHWVWTQHPTSPHPNIMRGLAALGRAWLLTGDPRYAHKAAVLLHRTAEVYPNMDHESQSRYGELMAAKDGSRYSGKIINAIWETYFVAQLAETYDAIWETIDGDAALQAFTGKGGRDLRAFIEANVIEDGIDAIYERRARGNYGMHQRALLIAAIVRQHGDNARYLNDLLDKPEGASYLGIRRALYGLVWRDGQPFESPEYNSLWVQNLTAVTSLLPKLGVDVSTLPRLRRLYDAPLAAIAIGRHTPALGDTSSVYGGVVGEAPSVYQQAFRTYGDPRYAAFLAAFGGAGDGGFRDFASLQHPPLEAAVAPPADRRVTPQRSRLLSGFGLALLNDPADETAVSLYFGQHVSHFHFDRLHFDLFARGWPLTPDLGYPDAMNIYVPGVWTWSVNTIAHNTVTVDAAAQPGNAPGVVELFADAGWVRGVEVSAAGTYPQCADYRRGLVLVDAPGGGRYLVDFFNVTGGRQHDYSLHGPPGTSRLADDAWSAPAPGTLAGEKVQLGELYDDPAMAAAGPTQGYFEYRGSGFQHLFNVQRRTGGDAVVDYVHEKDPAAALRIRVLAAPGLSLMAADARVSPVKNPHLLKYLIARHAAPEGDGLLRSEFVSVLEPHAPGEALMTAATRLTVAGGGRALLLTHANGESDIVIHDPAGSAKTVATARGPVTTDARLAVVRLSADGRAARVFFAGGSGLGFAGQSWELSAASASVTGEVVAVDPAKSEFRLRLGGAKAAGDIPAALRTVPPAGRFAGRVVTLGNGFARTAHTLMAAHQDGDELVLTLQDDLLAGLMRVTAVAGSRLETRAQLPFAPSYVGATVYDDAFRPLGRIRSAELDHLILEAPPADGAALVGRDVWIGSVGPGDRLDLPAVFTWQR
ncbi:MAG: heparinase II/III family protein [Opitutaceae bacterium]|nr:heparinase II/III family protein [Opitutaceae bacterium]